MTTPMHDAFAQLLGDILGRCWFAARHAKAARQDASYPSIIAPPLTPSIVNDTGVIKPEGETAITRP